MPHGPITTDRLVLRLHRESDGPALQAIFGRDDVSRYMLWEPWSTDHTTEQLEKRLAMTGLDAEPHGLAFVVEHDGAVVGDAMLTLTDVERGVAEIGWSVHPDHAGRGYATEAAAAVIDAGFSTYGLHRIFAQLDARNAASERLCERLGMTREAHFRQDWWSKGEWTDTLVYALLAADPRP